MQRKLVTTIAVTAWALSTSALALPPAGQPDPTFGADGTTSFGFDLGDGNHDVARVVASDAQDRLYVIGNSTTNNEKCLSLARLLPNGALDAGNYGDEGKICHENLLNDGSIAEPSGALFQPDGMLVVSGVDRSSLEAFVCRFDASGHLDTAGFGAPPTPGCAVFNEIRAYSGGGPGSTPGGGLGTVSMTHVGQWIMVAMKHIPEDNGPYNTVVGRLSSSGEIIPFGQAQAIPALPLTPGNSDIEVSDILASSNGMLVLTGAANTSQTSGWDFFVAAVDPQTGKPDASFNNGTPLFFDAGAQEAVATALALTADGNIVVGGAGGDYDEARPIVAVITPAGHLAAQFNNGQPASYNPCVFYFGDCDIYVTGLDVLPSGKLLLGGYARQDGFERLFTMRLLSNGTPDPSYGPNIPGQQGYVRIPGIISQGATSMLMQNGRPVLAGWRDMGDPAGYDFLLARISDGALFRDGYEAQP